MRKLRATSENPMVRRVERFALSLLPATSSPIPELQNACAFAPMTRTFRSGSQEPQNGQLWGLQTCGSVWVCPVCGAKVVERRRGEIQQAMAMHRACGGEVHLLTLTVPHTRFDALEGLLERQGKALQGFLRDRKVKGGIQRNGLHRPDSRL